MATGILCNTLLILAITFDPLGILCKGAWVTILNLAVADFLTCASIVAPKFQNIVPRFVLIVIFFVNHSSASASFMFLTLLTVQVYMIIKYPIKSRLILTKMKVALACLVVWVLAMLLGLSEIAGVWIQGIETLYFFIANFIVLTLVVVIPLIVFKVLIVVEILRSRRDDVNAETQNKKKKNLAKTIIMLNVMLIVTAFPFYLAKMIGSFYFHLPDENVTMFRRFLYYFYPVFTLNFTANPIIYSLRLQDYRRSLFALFSCKSRKRRNNVQQRPRQPMIEMPTR